MFYRARYQAPIGEMILTSDGRSLVGVRLAANRSEPISGDYKMLKLHQLELFLQTKDWLDRYFAKEMPKISELPLLTGGTGFSQAVWTHLLKIPYGTTTTYGEIAKKIAQERNQARMSAQAVGGAVGRNPIPVIIPCHRVIGKNGRLIGYGGGLPMKIWLLKHESSGTNTPANL